jgi:hypothetical protein
MKSRLVSILSAVALTAFVASVAQAQATRTWVSGVGDDANPCSRTAPCKTFAGAISKTAPGGEIDALDPGGFGTVTITKSITIDGGGTLASVLASGVNGVVINALSTDTIILRRLSINGATGGLVGVKIFQAKQVSIENCYIFGFSGSPGRGVSVEANTGANIRVNVTDTTVENTNGSGFVALPPAGQVPTIKVSIAHSNFRYNGSSGSGGSGIFLGEGTKGSVDDCNITNADFAGVDSAGTSSPPAVVVSNSTLAWNSRGVHTGANAALSISNNVIFGNTLAWEITAGTIRTFGNNRVDNNAGSGSLTTISPAQQ